MILFYIILIGPGLALKNRVLTILEHVSAMFGGI